MTSNDENLNISAATEQIFLKCWNRERTVGQQKRCWTGLSMVAIVLICSFPGVWGLSLVHYWRCVADVTRVNDKILFENHSIIVEATKESWIPGFQYIVHIKNPVPVNMKLNSMDSRYKSQCCQVSRPRKFLPLKVSFRYSCCRSLY